jgi:hypothetical protein
VEGTGLPVGTLKVDPLVGAEYNSHAQAGVRNRPSPDRTADSQA